MDALRQVLMKVVGAIGTVAALWYVGLYVLGYAILRPSYLDDPAQVVGFFDDYTTVKVGAWLFGLSVVGLMWFLGSLADDLREIGEGRLARIAAGGGLVGAASLTGAAALLWTGSARLEDVGPAGASNSELLTLFDLSNALQFVAAPIGFGVAVLAVTAADARAHRAPVAVTMLAALLAVALWIPWISRFVVGAWLAWVLFAAWNVRRHASE